MNILYKMSLFWGSKKSKEDEELMKQTIDTSQFSLKGETHRAKVVKVYDGDTVHIVLKKFNQFFRFNCRISGVDTPELRTKNTIEKQMGYMVRDKLSELILDKIVTVHCDDFDKYGRLLIRIDIMDSSSNPIDISDWLISNEYAYAYGGGTKQSWEEIFNKKKTSD